MRTIFKHIIGRTYKPALEKYLSRTRRYEFEGIRLKIPPEVFHPAFFSSTHILLKEILSLQLEEKKFLELGAGSGLISMAAAKKGAIVTASELNHVAVEYLAVNSSANGIGIEIRESDLFIKIPRQPFDIIAINPPYYKKNPANEKELAWYCGEKGEYFTRLFQQLPDYIHDRTTIVMILCDGCDLDMIGQAASNGGFCLKEVGVKNTLIEKNFIYHIQLIASL
jgi:release factor glutamine methyltransferase